MVKIFCFLEFHIFLLQKGEWYYRVSEISVENALETEQNCISLNGKWWLLASGFEGHKANGRMGTPHTPCKEQD